MKMGKCPRKNHRYYAVIHGFYLSTPTIFSSWGDTHPLVTGFKNPNPQNPNFKSFVTLDEAEAFMAENRIENYEYKIKDDIGEFMPQKGQVAYYAVANGRSPGIHEYYHGGAELEVARFPGACHKRCRTRQQAESFIADWKESYACIDKAKIKEQLSYGHRAAQYGEQPK